MCVVIDRVCVLLLLVPLVAMEVIDSEGVCVCVVIDRVCVL